MAKKKEEKITPEGIRRAMELEKDKIEAALAGAVTNADGTHPTLPPVEKEGGNAKKSNPPESEEHKSVKDNVPYEINAKDMFEVSLKNPDAKINEHIKALNARIRNEALKGGFSTNVAFTVIQNDWVNIQHILDWYRSHGFQILNFDQSTAPYGRNAGTIQYNFTISWATPS